MLKQFEDKELLKFTKDRVIQTSDSSSSSDSPFEEEGELKAIRESISKSLKKQVMKQRKRISEANHDDFSKKIQE